MAYRLKDFKDIFDFVMEEMKHNENDTTNINRIKRDINAIYINEVAPLKRWRWLTKHTAVVHPAYYGSGTVSVTPSSTTITFSTAPATSKAGHYFAVDAYSEVYTISSHTAGSTTATLTSGYTGSLDTAAAFKTWIDKIALPTDARETVEVWHDFGNPLEGIGQQEIRKHIQQSGARSTGRATYYSTTDFYDPTSSTAETESDRYRQLQLFPAVYSTPTTYKIDYIQEVTELDLDGDEPAMPIEDRIVLAYGALARAWRRERNDQASMINQQLFQQKLDKMSGKVEDSQDTPQFTAKSDYLAKKRGSRFRAIPSSMGSGGGSSYQIPSYLEGTTINGANVTGAITVASSVTIDGRDISADGAVLDAHLVDAVDAHDASAISVVPTGNLVATDVQSALAEIQLELDGALDVLDLAAHTNATSDAHDASAISVVPAGNLAATEIQAALEELQTDIDSGATNLSNHLSDATDAHDASAISSVASGNLAATDVQSALNELQADIDTRATTTALSDHLNDAVDAHDASAISFSPVGTIAATDAQAAIAEVATDAASALTTHESDTSTHGVSTVAGLSETQTFSAKTFSDPITLAEVATPATPASGFGKIYFKSDGKLYQLNDDGTESQVGSGGGGINHLSANPDAESGTTGYVVSKNTSAAATPDSGFVTGSTNITWTRTTSSPLRSTGSFLLTKDAVNRQGEQVYVPFTPSRADRYSVHTISGTYEIASGTYADGDLTLWIQDATSGAFIQPVGYSLSNIGVNGKFQATFQTTDSVSYKLIIHVASTSASAYTVKFDDLFVGPQSIARGPMISDWQAYTPTFTGFGTAATVTFFHRRVGGNVEIQGRFTSGTPTAVEARISLPAGLTISPTEVPSIRNVGILERNVAGGAYHYVMIGEPSLTYMSIGASNASFAPLTKQTTSTPFAAADVITVNASIPIAGWSSNQVLSSEEDGRVCAFTASNAAATSLVNGAETLLPFATVGINTHNAYSSNRFTAPLPGKYRFYSVARLDSGGGWASTESFYLVLRKNGATQFARGLNTQTATHSAPSMVAVEGMVDLVAGDYVEVLYFQNSGAAIALVASALDNRFEGMRLSGPSQIAASETIAARYTTVAGQTNTTGNTAIINYGTVDYDTHGAVTTGASWKFTAPIAGKYRVTATFLTDATGSSPTPHRLSLYKNGSVFSQMAFGTVPGTVRASANGSDEINLLAGEYVDVRWNNGDASTRTLTTTASENHISIIRVGN